MAGVDGISGLVRAGDRDRYVTVLFAPGAKRAALMALHAYDLALGDVLRTTTEAQVGLIRLAWWRDAVSGPLIAGQPVLTALAAARLDPAPLAALAEAYMDRIEGADAGECGALLFGMAAARLGGAAADVAAAGRYWSAANAQRRGESVEVPEFAPAHFPAALRPVTALAAVARRDIAGRREPRGSAGRQWIILRHMLTGRA